MGSPVVTVVDETFEAEVLNAPNTVLAYFWAPWCGPCRLVSPSIDAVAEIYGDRLKVAKIEVDPNPQAVGRYKIQGVPTLVLLREGTVLASHEGAVTKPKLIEWIETHLGATA